MVHNLNLSANTIPILMIVKLYWLQVEELPSFVGSKEISQKYM